MNLPIPSETREARFAAYVDALAEGLGHADRIAPMQALSMGVESPVILGLQFSLPDGREWVR